MGVLQLPLPTRYRVHQEIKFQLPTLTGSNSIPLYYIELGEHRGIDKMCVVITDPHECILCITHVNVKSPFNTI